MATTGADAQLLIGEVHTGLLQNSVALPAAAVARILRVRPGERVRTHDRPIRHAVSPAVLTGVDCRLYAARSPRVVGVVASHAAVTGGHVLQTSSFARVVAGGRARRAAWSAYLSRPGVVETLGRPLAEDAGEDFLSADRAATGVDLDAINAWLMGVVQSSHGLDRRAPIRVPRTKLRWVARLTATPRVHFVVEEDFLRSLHIGFVAQEPDPWPSVVTFCEDVARHDWLLTGLLHTMDKALDARHEDLVRRLRPVFDHLLHLWMPAARTHRSLAPLWPSLEREAGFSRQWETSATWIRDQVGIATLGRRDRTR